MDMSGNIHVPST